jgi:hypothetical protein
MAGTMIDTSMVLINLVIKSVKLITVVSLYLEVTLVRTDLIVLSLVIVVNLMFLLHSFNLII